MCNPLAIIAGSAVLGAGVSAVQGAKAAKAQSNAQKQAQQQADAQAQRAETQFNKANQQQPGIAALMTGNKQLTSRGVGSTFLTGSKGVGTSMLSLGGAPTLLGA